MVVAETLADAMRVFFADITELDGATHSLNDMQFVYYSDRSGLTPIWHYSLTDHMRAFFLSLVGSETDSVDDLEQAYYRLEGAVGPSYDDVKYDYYTNQHGGLVFYTDNHDGTGYVNALLATTTDNGDGTAFIHPPGEVTVNGDGTSYAFLGV